MTVIGWLKLLQSGLASPRRPKLTTCQSMTLERYRELE
jgi:hypothetical protein